MSLATEEKTEKATDYKLRKAREKGQVSKSMDVTSTASLLVTLIMVMAMISHVGVVVLATTSDVFILAANLDVSSSLDWLLNKLFNAYLSALMPVFLTAIIFGVLINLLQTKGVFSFHPLKPNIGKLNPIKGLKKLFSMKSLFELAKNILRLSFISVMAWYLFYDEIFYIPDNSGISVWLILERTQVLFGKTVALFILTILPFTLFDLVFQNWSFAKEMRMTKKELKDQYKSQDGDQEIKQKRRQLQKELRSKVGSLTNVSNADVVITNPTHIAIALKYDEETMTAPKVISKGKGPIAEAIKEIAREHRIHTKTNIPLARAIYRKIRIGREIPPEFYDEVSEIYKWLLKSKNANL
ncbi:EscU/YscU/HrcU family type III secretion system export apparatus switch protein [Enterovibrio norvegicus]|uniref:EscU/YscU/HrcU family type III secretion system export apparatus switch protein n=1 Tax=Enterovibrio norvegicus TaxID=188144 RepID=UPI001FD22BEE|nr:EscU/YscU/HrcU family type III secretion system export apparatus switch protein [Enterovibrio norvegicus]